MPSELRRSTANVPQLARLLGIDHSELGKALRLLTLVFVTSAALVWMKAAQSGIFLSVHGKNMIPWAFAASALVLASSSAFLVAAAGRSSPVTLATRTLGLIAAAMLALRTLLFLPLDSRISSFIVYVVIEASAGVALIQLWSVVSDTLDARSAKRLSPIAGVGASLAWGLVGLGTGPLVQLVGAKGLLVLAPMLLGVALLLLAMVAKRDTQERAKRDQQRPSLIASWKAGLAFVSQERLMRLTLALTVLALVTEQICDYLMLAAARERYSDAAGIASFFGTYYGITSLLSTALLLTISGRFLSVLGATKSLALTPLVTTAFATVTIFLPGLGPKVLLRASDRVLKAALWTSAMEQTQTPLPSIRRAQARALSRGVIAPMAYAVAAVVLGLMPASLDGRWLSAIAAAMMLLMVGIILAGIHRQYVKALKNAIDARRLHLDMEREVGAPTSQLDAEACESLGGEVDETLAELASGNSHSSQTLAELEARALLACELLTQARNPTAQDALIRALKHSAPSVRSQACAGLGIMRAESAVVPLANRLHEDPVSEVRRAACRALRSLKRNEEQVRIAFRAARADTDRSVRAIATVALLELENAPSFASGSSLLPLLEGAEVELRAEALGCLGKRALRNPQVIQALGVLLEHEASEVRLAALDVVTAHRVRSLLTKVGPLLENAGTAAAAMSALASWTSEDPEALSVLSTPSVPIGMEPSNAPAPISLTDGQSPVSRLIDHVDLAVRERATTTMARLVRRGHAPVPVKLVEPILDREVLAAHRLHAVLFGLERTIRDSADKSAIQRLVDEINLHQRHLRDRIVQLLGVIEGRKLSRALQAGLRRPTPAQLAQVAELLDVVLKGERTRRLVPLFDKLSLTGRIDRARSLGVQVDDAIQDPLATLVGLGDVHLEGCAALALRDDFSLRFPTRYVEIAPMLPLLSRMAFLRSVPLFSDLAGEDLRQVAQIVEDLSLPEGDIIFRKGDPGEDLYLILQGSVLIRDGEVDLRTLGPRDFFGELAVLDREPRSADALCLADTTLLRLRGADLGELLARRPQIQEEILLYLVRRVRDLSKRVVK